MTSNNKLNIISLFIIFKMSYLLTFLNQFLLRLKVAIPNEILESFNFKVKKKFRIKA